MSHPPIALALVLCDQVLVEPGSNKYTLVGLFSAIAAPDFPCMHQRIAIYAALTDGYGVNKLTLRIVAGDSTAEEIWRIETSIDFTDPRGVYESYNMAGPIPIPRPGEYRLRAEVDGHVLMERRLLATKITPPPKPA